MSARSTAIAQIEASLETRTELGRPVAEALAGALLHEVAADGTSAPYWRELADLLTAHAVPLLTAADVARRVADTAGEVTR